MIAPVDGWELLNGATPAGDGSWRQYVRWNGPSSSTVEQVEIYSFKIDAEAKKQMDLHLQFERMKGSGTSASSVYIAFLNRKSEDGSNPPAVNHETLTIIDLNDIIGIENDPAKEQQ